MPFAAPENNRGGVGDPVGPDVSVKLSKPRTIKTTIKETGNFCLSCLCSVTLELTTNLFLFTPTYSTNIIAMV